MDSPLSSKKGSRGPGVGIHAFNKYLPGTRRAEDACEAVMDKDENPWLFYLSEVCVVLVMSTEERKLKQAGGGYEVGNRASATEWPGKALPRR